MHAHDAPAQIRRLKDLNKRTEQQGTETLATELRDLRIQLTQQGDAERCASLLWVHA